MAYELSANIAITITALVAFVLGGIVCYLVLFARYTGGADVIATLRAGKASVSAGADFMPAIVLLVVTLCFTGGLAYVVNAQIYGKNKEQAKDGIKNAIGISWGLFIFAAVLIPFALEYARISADSKYYLIASLFTFYFSTIAAIIVFFDRLHSLPEQKDDLDMSTTYNTLVGLFALLVGYGAYGILIM
jgi:hypothetical protein